uniref:C2H2-type domain-containing protein n=1 Tax=Erythrolobus australicus TaxID=1077150 RepID=A0A7S1XH38_9RHOD|mmetsp:Transcript_3480/g.9524  ORF Transcript_3480/g.9524 Transcript_3480/m.9524 type:complete len:473 (+) Transcript_3480:106-1524(+)
MEVSEEEVRAALRRAFGNETAADWLLSRSEAPPLALSTRMLHSSFSTNYSLFSGEDKLNHEDVGLFQSGSNTGVMKIECLLMQHWSLGKLIFCTIFDVSPSVFYDVNSSCPAVRRMIVDLSSTKGLQMYTHCFFANGMSVLSDSLFPVEGGFRCLNLLFSDYSPRTRPTARDVTRTALLLESTSCQFCLLRGMPCSCSREFYLRAHPPADTEIFTWEHWVSEFAKLRNRFAKSSVQVRDAQGNLLGENVMLSRVSVTRETKFNTTAVLRRLRQRYLDAVLPTDMLIETRLLSLPAVPAALSGGPSSSDVPVAGFLGTDGIHEYTKRPKALTAREAPVDELLGEAQQSGASASTLEAEDSSAATGTRRERDEVSNERVAAEVKSARRSLVCKKCGNQFLRQFDLDRHYNATHLRIKPWKCEACGAAFAQKTHLTTHMSMVHLRAKQFPCADCGKLFSSASNMRKHVRTLHQSS